MIRTGRLWVGMFAVHAGSLPERGALAASADVSSLIRSSQEAARNEDVEHRATRGRLEAPEPLGLTFRQRQPWHVVVLTTHSLQPAADVFAVSRPWIRHVCPLSSPCSPHTTAAVLRRLALGTDRFPRFGTVGARTGRRRIRALWGIEHLSCTTAPAPRLYAGKHIDVNLL
jgi:hypothetical protein